MEHVTGVLKKFIDQRQVGNASLDELDITLSQNQPDISSLPRGEVIKNYHLITTFQQLLSQVRANESRPTGNDCCVFTQDSPEPRYLKIFTGAVVVVASVGYTNS